MDKSALRKLKAKERDSLSQSEVQALSDMIIRKLMNTEAYRNAKTILTYVSFRSEVITDDLILTALNDGKKVGVPKVEGDKMTFYKITSLDMLEAGYFGVREPLVTEEELDPEGCLMIVPGLAFDYELDRIGYGKGFYDKYFTAYADKSFTKCGIAFDCQMCEKIEADPFDQPLDMLITETSVFT